MNNVFLKGELKEDMYMAKTKGFKDSSKPGHICKFTKAMYGIKQAPGAWYEKLNMH